jgi:hypothetical protein
MRGIGESRQDSTAALDLIHGEVEAVGEVEATDEAHALAKAAEQFKVPATKLIAIKRTDGSPLALGLQRRPPRALFFFDGKLAR